MTTAWWIVVCCLLASLCFSLGYVLRAEMELWRTANDIDLVGLSRGRS